MTWNLPMRAAGNDLHRGMARQPRAIFPGHIRAFSGGVCMCAKYSAEWWQRVAQATSELMQQQQAAPSPRGGVDNRMTGTRSDRPAQPGELLATPADR